MHAKSLELQATRKKEAEERASRGVRLCNGGGDQKCPDKTELPMTSSETVCEACSKKVKERANINRAKRIAATAERNKAKEGKKECTICHNDYPLADFQAERRLKTTGGFVSDRCKNCRERAKEVKADCLAADRAKEKREQELAVRKEVASDAKKEGHRICSRHGSVTQGCWVVLPDDYEGATCEPCIKLREEYNAYKKAKKEEEAKREEEAKKKEERGDEIGELTDSCWIHT
jgi:hypothetical protein